jgi:hypothetical protein
MRVVLLLVGVLVLTAVAANVQADSVTLSCIGDNTIIEAGGASTLNAGGAPDMYVGYWSGAKEESALLRFDVSPLSSVPDLQVNSVTLKLFISHVDDWTASIVDEEPVVSEVHAVSAANAGWVQGTKIFTGAADGESAWDFRAKHTPTSTNWAGSAGLRTPTTDYDPTVLASQTFLASPALNTEIDYTFSGTPGQLTSLITGWMAANGGLFMFDRPEGGHTALSTERLGFHTMEATTAGYRPQLVVDYVSTPEPGTLVLMATGLLGLVAYAWRKRK